MAEQKPDKSTPSKLEKPTPSKCERAFVIIFHALTVVIILLIFLQFLRIPIVVNEFLKWFYLALLALYVGQKEGLRWFANMFTDRLGEIYVYVILGLVVIMGGLNSIWPLRFIMSDLLKQVAIPIAGAFIATETSKAIFNKRLEKKNGNGNGGTEVKSEKKPEGQ